MAIETEHRGYKITYSENGDEWVSYEAGDGVSAPTLSKLKEKIDRLALAIRKASSTTCWELDYSKPTVVESSIIEYQGAKIQWSQSSQKQPYIREQTIAVVAARNGSGRAARRVTSLDKMIPDTPEALAMLDKAKVAYQAKLDAEKAYNAARAAIPRLTLDDIAALVKISGLDPTGGL